jgi:hypothetical protein
MQGQTLWEEYKRGFKTGRFELEVIGFASYLILADYVASRISDELYMGIAGISVRFLLPLVTPIMVDIAAHMLCHPAIQISEISPV